MKELVDLSRSIGSRIPAWTQGTGGNLSFKEGGILSIKASGYRLDQASGSGSILSMAQDRLLEGLRAIRDEAEYHRLLAEAEAEGRRPSMETAFHALLPRKWVIHFHSLPAILMAHQRDVEADRMNSWMQRNCSLSVSWIASCLPGFGLGKALAAFPEYDVFIVRNHGVVLHSDTPRIVREWESVEDAFRVEFGYQDLERSPERFPLRSYFPDAVVAAARLKTVLVRTDSREKGGEALWSLPRQTKQEDRNVLEIAQAIGVLYRNCPDLEELPQAIRSELLAMPSEKWRLRRI